MMEEEGCRHKQFPIRKGAWQNSADFLSNDQRYLQLKHLHICLICYTPFISADTRVKKEYTEILLFFWDVFISVLREETWLFSRIVVKNWFLSVKMSRMHTYAHVHLCTNVHTHIQHTPLHTFTHRYAAYTQRHVFQLRAILPSWAILYCQARQMGVRRIWASTTTFSCV